ncbi:hypothetical protein AWRI1631_81320, partial [Saccharomyces cerevisiae AWRI1631]
MLDCLPFSSDGSMIFTGVDEKLLLELLLNPEDGRPLDILGLGMMVDAISVLFFTLFSEYFSAVEGSTFIPMLMLPGENDLLLRNFLDISLGSRSSYSGSLFVRPLEELKDNLFLQSCKTSLLVFCLSAIALIIDLALLLGLT